MRHPVCDSYRIQTCNLLIRSQMLYSVELRSLSEAYALFAFASAKLHGLFHSDKYFCDFFANFFVQNRFRYCYRCLSI